MEKVKILNRSGLNLSAVIHAPKNPSNSPLVILLHGNTGYKEETHIESLAVLLSENGFFSIRFDCSGSNESDGTFEKDYRFSNYLTDVADVLEYAKKLPGLNKDKIGLWGHAMGGQLACIFASAHPQIKSLCIVSSPSVLILPPEDEENLAKFGYYEMKSSKLGTVRLPAAYFEERSKYDASISVKNLKIPKLIIWGTSDDVVPAERKNDF